jgi:hypothetical protein
VVAVAVLGQLVVMLQQVQAAQVVRVLRHQSLDHL